MSFTDQLPFTVSQKQATTKWGRCGHGKLACQLCGHIAEAGETFRWIYANGPGSKGEGNFFVCQDCDGTDALERGRDSFQQAKKLAQQWGVYGPDWQEQ